MDLQLPLVLEGLVALLADAELRLDALSVGVIGVADEVLK